MMLKKIMLTICLAAVYTTHCAHAAVDFKDKDPSATVCSTKNLLLAAGKHYDPHAGYLVVITRVVSDTPGPNPPTYNRCNYAYIGCNPGPGKQCALKRISGNKCPATITGTQDAKNKSIYKFTVDDEQFSNLQPSGFEAKVDLIHWVANQETPDFTLTTSRENYDSTPSYQVTLDTSHFEIQVSDTSGEDNIECFNSVVSSASPLLKNDETLTYTITTIAKSSESIKCSATYNNNQLTWNKSNDPACYSKTLNFRKALDKKLLDYQMIDLSPIITNVPMGYSVLDVTFKDMTLQVDTLNNTEGTNSGNLYLYTNGITTALLPRINPKDVDITFWYGVPTWVGLDNLLVDGQLPNQLLIAYGQTGQNQFSCTYIYNKTMNTYKDFKGAYTSSAGSLCPQSIKLQDNKLNVQVSVYDTTTQYNVDMINLAPSETSSPVVYLYSGSDPLTIQFSPANHKNGVVVSSKDLVHGACTDTSGTLQTTAGRWLPCATRPGDPWAGFGNILTNKEWPDKFTVYYYTSVTDSEQCVYQRTGKVYKPLSAYCPLVQLQDDIVYVPTKMNNGALLGNIILENARAVVAIKNFTDKETTAGPAIMQFNPPNYPSGIRVTHQNISSAVCLDMDDNPIIALNQWQTCSNK